MVAKVRYDYTGKVILVTGAGRGIGKAIAQGFAAEGADLCLFDIEPGGLSALAESLSAGGSKVSFFVGDVAKANDVAALFDQVDDEFGCIDVLVNNAGVEPVSSILDHSLEDWQRALDVNLTGTFLCTQQAALRMQGKGGGAILNIASIAGKSQPLYLRSAYAASKGGQVGFTKEAARELATFGIRVNAICPGVIVTPMTEHLRNIETQMERWQAEIPLGRLGEAEEVAALCLWLASTDAAYITGVAWHVDGGKNMA